MPGPFNRFQTHKWLISLGITLATLGVYWQVTTLGFVDYDDGDYVFENPVVQDGLTWSGLTWAFEANHASNWHPLTWISHMADCQIFNLNPGGHHFTNLLIHLINALLLLALLHRFTGAFLPGSIVAALFALHPLHVESVAWIAERKDVLSTFFGLLALLAYERFQRPLETRGSRSQYFYALSVILFAFSLMCKPMLVTLPFVLLLLDYWPGRRLNSAPDPWPSIFLRLLLEKIPFFILSAVSCIITYQVQRGSTVMPLESFGVLDRTGNALVAYVVYLRRVLWPSDLAFFYPLSPRPVWQVIGSGFILVAITGAVIVGRNRRPFALVGWLWFLGTLVPVIGLVQVGEQSMADRYTYLPIIGVFITVVWSTTQWLDRRPSYVPATAGLSLLALLACSVITWHQVGYWKNSRTLLEHALAVTQDNFLAHNNLGFVLAREGDIEAAIPHFQEALQIKPEYARAHRNLAAAFVEKGQLAEAEIHYRRAVELQPADVEALHNLGAVLARQGKLDQAAVHCARAVELDPGNPMALYDFATVLNLQRKHQEAASLLRRSLQVNPGDPLAHFQLGLTLAHTQEWQAAAGEFEKALVLRPDWPDALCELASVLATANDPDLRSPPKAVTLAEKANQLTHGTNPLILAKLAAAYASAENFSEAASAAKLAVAAADKAGLTRLAEQTRACLNAYREGRPCVPQPRSPPTAPSAGSKDDAQ